MTPEDLDIMKREPRPGFLERRGANIFAPYSATIPYGDLQLTVVRNPAAMYDYYYLQSYHKLLGTFKHCLLRLAIPKVVVGYGPGFFDMFGEKIEDEKHKK